MLKLPSRLLTTAFPRRAVARLGLSFTGSVWLTFDDGPHPQNTPLILEALHALEVSATFFVTGAECRCAPELVRRVLDAGHQVANHGFEHLAATKVSANEYVANVGRCQRLLEAIADHPLPRLYRPPYGELTPSTFVRLTRAGYRFVLWSFDSDDSRIREPEVLAARFAGSRVPDRAILLLHEDYPWTVSALPQIVNFVRQQGLSFVDPASLVVESAGASESRPQMAPVSHPMHRPGAR